MRILETNEDHPDVYRLEEWLLTDKFPFVPDFVFIDGFHYKLLDC